MSRDTQGCIHGLAVFTECLAEGVASGDQHRCTGSGSAWEACLQWCTCTIQVYGL